MGRKRRGFVEAPWIEPGEPSSNLPRNGATYCYSSACQFYNRKSHQAGKGKVGDPKGSCRSDAVLHFRAVAFLFGDTLPPIGSETP